MKGDDDERSCRHQRLAAGNNKNADAAQIKNPAEPKATTRIMQKKKKKEKVKDPRTEPTVTTLTQKKKVPSTAGNGAKKKAPVKLKSAGRSLESKSGSFPTIKQDQTTVEMDPRWEKTSCTTLDDSRLASVRDTCSMSKWGGTVLPNASR
jgi:hypothetical protein